MADLKEINIASIKEGDILTLRGFHIMDEIGEEVTGLITEDHHWSNDILNLHGFELDLNDDISLMLLIKRVKDLDEVRLFRKWHAETKNIMQETQDDIPFWKQIPSNENEKLDETFVDVFSIQFEPEEDTINYSRKDPFPFWDMQRSDGDQVAICEYQAVNDNIPPTYWAKHCFVEWYAFVGESGMGGLVTIWFGWDIGMDDFQLLF